MRKLFMAVVAALLAAAMPGMASAMTNARLGVSYGNYDYGESSSDVDMFGFNGAFSHDFDNGMTLQADAAQDDAELGSVDIGVSYAAVSLGTRNDKYALYGFVGMNDLIFSGNSFGVGGQVYFDQATVNASAARKEHDGELEATLTNIHIDGTWFLNDNVGITAEYAHSEFEIFYGETDWDTLGVAVSFRPDDSPFTVEARYQTRDFESDDVDTFRISLSYDLGGPRTAQEQSRSGPSFNGASSLHDEVRAIPVLIY